MPSSLLALLRKRLVSVVKEPQRILDLPKIITRSIVNGRCSDNVHYRSWFLLTGFLSLLPLKARIGENWSLSRQRFRRRVYSKYEDYLTHQKDKLARIELSNYDAKYRRVLRKRLRQMGVAWQGKTILCLGARIGTEVKSFLDLGCFAVGIDINPGEKNRHVVYGDFHDIQYPSSCTDVVFTNSLDHAFDVEKLIKEVSRVLKPGGLAIVEVGRGIDEGGYVGFYESFYWSKVDDVISLFRNLGFRFVGRESFNYPCNGVQLSFLKEQSIESESR
jgi:SAM-dependent methyltransferase